MQELFRGPHVNVFTMSLDLKGLVIGGGVESFAQNIIYCQLNALSIFSILYHLVKVFLIHARNRDLFSIAELIISNILSFQIIYLNGRNKTEIQNSKSIAVFKNKLLSFIKPIKRSILNVNHPEGVKYLTRLSLPFSHLNERKFRHGFLDT